MPEPRSRAPAPPAPPDTHLEAHGDGSAFWPALPRLRLVRHLGTGGMGTVYEAADTSTGRECAVKVLSFASRSRLVRFKREFRTAARLSHPACIRVHELGSAFGAWYFTMELLPHGSLSQRLQNGLLAPLQAARVARQVLSALDHLHAHDIVHRDLKPANILLGDRDLQSLRLADLGVAQVGGLEDELDGFDLVGSLRYLAPEVLERGAADPRADLYALGVILLEALAGAHPTGSVRGAGEEAARSLAPPSWVAGMLAGAGVPGELVTFVLRLLERDPDDRYRSAADAFADLEPWYRATEDAAQFRQTTPFAPRPYLAATSIVGRDDELQRCQAFFDATLRGTGPHPPLVLSVTGSAGSGKSRLVRRVTRRIRASGATVLHAECREEVGAPYREIFGVFSALAAAATPPNDAEATVSRDAKTPSTESPTTGAAGGGALDRRAEVAEDPGDFPRRHLDRAVQLLSAATERAPVVVVVEDLQWIDVASLQLLTSWVRATAIARRGGERVRVAFVVVHREAGLHSFYEAARELSTLEAIEVPPLPCQAINDLVAALLGVPASDECAAFARAVFSGTPRTPLFVKQMLRILLFRGLLWPRGEPWRGEWKLDPEVYARVELPRTLQEAVGDRAAKLSVETQRALGMAAVGGRRFDTAVLEHALGYDDTLLLDCLDEAERAGFVLSRAQSESQYLFAHDRYRESIYESLSTTTRREHHRAWASALIARGDRAVDLSAELAHHFSLSQEHERAHHYAVSAAAAAMASSAFVQAAQMYRLARASAEGRGALFDPALSEDQGDASLNAGLYEDAAECYRERLASCTAAERPPLLVKMAEVRYRAAKERALEPESVLASIEQTMEELDFAKPRTALGLRLAIVGNVLALMAFGLVPSLVETERRPSEPRKLALCSISLLAAEAAYFFSPTYNVFYTLKAATLAVRLGPTSSSSVALGVAAFGMAQMGLSTLAGRFERLSGELESSLVTAPDRALASLLRGFSAYCRTDLTTAEVHLRHGARAVERSSEPLRRAFVNSVLGFLLAHRGSFGKAYEVARGMTASGELEGMSYLRFCGHSVAAVAAFLSGEYGRAREEIVSCYGVKEAIGDDFSRMTTELQQRTYDAVEGGEPEAERCLRIVIAYQERGFTSAHVSFAAHALAAMFLGASRRGPLAGHFRTRLARAVLFEWRRVHLRFRHHRPLLLGVRAALLRVQGKGAAAARAFTSAREEALAIGILGELGPVDLLDRASKRAADPSG